MRKKSAKKQVKRLPTPAGLSRSRSRSVPRPARGPAPRRRSCGWRGGWSGWKPGRCCGSSSPASPPKCPPPKSSEFKTRGEDQPMDFTKFGGGLPGSTWRSEGQRGSALPLAEDSQTRVQGMRGTPKTGGMQGHLGIPFLVPHQVERVLLSDVAMLQLHALFFMFAQTRTGPVF